MMPGMSPTEIKSLIAEAKDAFGSANADKLGRLVERLAAALEHAAAMLVAQQTSLAERGAEIQRLERRLAERDTKILALEKHLAEQVVEISELKTGAGERAAELAYLKAQVFGPKSEKLRYKGDAAEAAKTPAGVDDEDSADVEPAKAASSAGAAPGAEQAALPSTSRGQESTADTPLSDQSSSEESATTPGSPAPAAEPATTPVVEAAASAAAQSPPAPAAEPATTPAAAATATDDSKTKKAKRQRARKLERERQPAESKKTVFSPELAHQIVHHKMPPALNLPCPLCGDPVKSRGKSVASKEIDTAESTVVVKTHYQDKATCGCGALSFVMPGPVRAVPNMTFSPAFAARVLVDKFFAHLPLNRQAAIFAQQGLKISRDRLIMLVLGCWLEVEALVCRIREINRAQAHQGCDESPIRVVVDGEKGQRFLWCLTSKQAVTYQITEGRNKATAREVIGGAVGTLTSDRLAIYRLLFEGKAESGCMSHLRRYWWYALDTAPDEAMPVIELIGKLYEVEAEAKREVTAR